MTMVFQRRTIWAAVLAGVVGAAGARAAEPASPEQTNQESTAASPPPAERSPFGEKYYPASPPAQRRPLMSLLERAGLSGPLDNARIRIFGHVEASYTWNPDDPAQHERRRREQQLVEQDAPVEAALLNLHIERQLLYRP